MIHSVKIDERLRDPDNSKRYNMKLFQLLKKLSLKDNFIQTTEDISTHKNLK